MPPRTDPELVAFCENLRQEVLSRADLEGEQSLQADAFTRLVIETLEEAGELDEAVECHHRARGVLVSGYGVEDEGTTLNLISTLHNGECPPTSVRASEIDAALKRLFAMWERCRTGPYHLDLEESSEPFDMALDIHRVSGLIRRIRLYVLTDGVTSVERLDTEDREGIEVQRSVWDIARLQRFMTSGSHREPISIDLEEFGGSIPCLAVDADANDYRAVMANIPGETLAQIYDRFGSRLLELNVRSFLQARGKVNRGIRDTLRHTPGRFLAYNNGISATASDVHIEQGADGPRLRSLRDLQIVNGGQTTASLHRAFVERADLTTVLVQAKITVVDAERLEEMVPLISRYANTQNRVVEADFSANDPFHVRVEELSRTVWAPAGEGEQRQTRWFYERARGSYADALARERTPARRRAFSTQHPRRQRFDKTDLAKFENTYDQLPYLVSRGAQKNFVEFMTRLARRSGFQPDVAYFNRLVAKAILFRTADRVVAAQNFGGYKINIVAYAVALLSHRSQQRIDLDRIWNRQALDPPLADALVDIAHIVQPIITNPAGGRNVGEWAKQPACWDAVRDISWELPSGLDELLVPLGRASRTAATGIDTPTEQEKELVARVAAISSDEWFALANWARQTDNLSPWQRKLAFGIGRRIRTHGEPTAKQAVQAARILEQAELVGYKPDGR
jgi:hypothetical protein